MGLFQWAKKRSRALNIWDIGVLKIFCVLFGMVAGAYTAAFVKQYVWWFVATIVVLGLFLATRWFTAKTD